jgi:hypothetical protein
MFDQALSTTDALLGFLPSGVRGAVVLPIAAAAVFVLLRLVLRMAPAIDKVLRPVGGGLTSVVGLVALLPEYAITTVLRNSGRPPPGVVFLYDELIAVLVALGRRFFTAGIAPVARTLNARRWVATAGMVAIVLLGNAGACPDPPGACRPPLVAWWQSTTSLFGSDGAAQPAPPPSRKTVKG